MTPKLTFVRFFAGRAGPVARLLARHTPSTGRGVSGLGPPRGSVSLEAARRETA